MLGNNAILFDKWPLFEYIRSLVPNYQWNWNFNRLIEISISREEQ